ncbi:glycosyltransferase family 4 protein [Vibrio parahaemolyticus]|nr:glycosyltransferase family 4 protein [Vibrio parahaemolyticus]
MKICHVNLASGFHGGENQTLLLIKQQLKMGYQLTVVANPKSHFYQRVQELPCRLIAAKHYLLSHRHCITNDCKLIHVHEGRAIYWALLQHKLYGVPYLITRRIDNPLSKKLFSNLAYRNASALVGLSKEIGKQIHQAYPQHPLSIIPSSPISYPIDKGIVAKLRQRFDNHFLVIHAANMLKHKGFDVTIQAAHKLQTLAPNIHIALLGDGKERPELEAQAEGLTNISFVGKQNDMGNWFAAANLLIHPSYSEGLGSVILEAMGSGLPVIGTQAGGIPDIIDHNISGLLIPPGDGEALADAIINIAQNAVLRDKLAEGRVKKIATFDIKYTSKLYQTLYESILNKEY